MNELCDMNHDAGIGSHESEKKKLFLGMQECRTFVLGAA
jgi:hypothetical protein